MEIQMKKLSRLQALLTIAVLAAGTASVAKADHGNGNNNNAETRLRTRLAGAAIQGQTPEGNADFRIDAKNRTRLNVEVEHVNLPAGTVLTVTVAGNVVGHITLSALGFGELELNSQDGDTVPAVKAGDMVVVSNGATAILTGVF
jgi:hypothetical protein